MTDILILSIAAFGSSLLTFYSGFGLGTIMLPVFLLYFPAETAVGLTAVIHFLNNIYKFILTRSSLDRGVLLRFGIPAIPAAVFGAYLLQYIAVAETVYTVEAGTLEFNLVPVNLLIASLLILFSLFDIVPGLKRLEFDKKYLGIGGFLSGFFGGLSGHQGALRSVFLIRSGLGKETFIATGIAIACLVDIARLSIYTSGDVWNAAGANAGLLTAGVFSAFAGAFLGNRFIKKMTLEGLQKIVAAALIIFSLFLAAGVL